MENAERSTRAVRGQLEEGSRSPAKYDGRSSSQHVLADASGGQAADGEARPCFQPGGLLLNTAWRILAAGKLMSEQPRYVAIRDGVLNHMAHHRGQLTVYLRLNEEKVPAIYGPSADEGKG